MKKIFAALLFSCIGYSLHAQISVEKITLKGTTYTVTRNIPDDLKVIFGVYTYEWGNEDEKAIVQLNEDGTGLFQPHMINPIRIQFWFNCDENGIVRKKEGVNGNYSVTLLLQYGESPNKNYATGSYDLMGVIVVPIENYAVIYGERYKKIH